MQALSKMSSTQSSSTSSSSAAAAASSEAGAAYSWILDHIMMYPSTYEYPLSTMYAFNLSAASQLLNGQPFPSGSSNPDDGEVGPSLAHRALVTPFGLLPPNTGAEAASAFQSNLMAQVAQTSGQPTSLPTSFVTSFIRREFPEDLPKVDFIKTPVALDYLRGLENRRRLEFAGVLKRLGANGDSESTGMDPEEKTRGHKFVEAWVKDMHEKSRAAESLYTQMYVGLRRWVCLSKLQFPI